jgi:hypothetical protein
MTLEAGENLVKSRVVLFRQHARQVLGSIGMALGWANTSGSFR